MPKHEKIDKFECFYNIPKMKQYRDTRFDDPNFTWEELRQKAKEIGAEVFYTSIYFDGIKFTKSGKVIMAFV